MFHFKKLLPVLLFIFQNLKFLGQLQVWIIIEDIFNLTIFRKTTSSGRTFIYLKYKKPFEKGY